MCAEGYLWELERRGYLSSGPFTPEVVLDQPERVTSLHEEFVHAGSDVVEAFTVIVTSPFITVSIIYRRYNRHHLHHHNRCYISILSLFQDGIHVLGKAHIRSTLSLKSFPNVVSTGASAAAAVIVLSSYYYYCHYYYYYYYCCYCYFHYMCPCSTSAVEDACRCTALHTLESK